MSFFRRKTKTVEELSTELELAKSELSKAKFREIALQKRDAVTNKIESLRAEREDIITRRQKINIDKSLTGQFLKGLKSVATTVGKASMVHMKTMATNEQHIRRVESSKITNSRKRRRPLKSHLDNLNIGVNTPFMTTETNQQREPFITTFSSKNKKSREPFFTL